MRQKKWLVIFAAFILTAALAAGTELALDNSVDRTVSTTQETTVLAWFPGETVSFVNCSLEDGYLTPRDNDPQLVLEQTDKYEIADMTLRFSEPLSEACEIQLFYDTGNGFNETESIVMTANAGDTVLTFPLEKGTYYNLCVDINDILPLESVDSSVEISGEELVPCAFRCRRASKLFVLLLILLIPTGLSLVDEKWKKSAVTNDMAYHVLLSFAICSFIGLYYHLGETTDLISVVRRVISPNWIAVALVFVFIHGGLIIAKKLRFNLFDWIHKWRWAIAGVVLIIAILLKINGSSLHLWSVLLGENDINGIVFGVARAIRADEWARGTPMVKALSYENFPFYSNIIRAAPTETVVTTGKITWDFSAIFHPFVWGFLLLGFSYGISFSWCARFIILFMTSYDLFMMLSKNRKISFAFAFSIVFSPMVQWWFGTAITELLICCFGLTIIARKYLTSRSVKTKILMAVVVFILMGNYVLTMYPAWIVPLVYVLLGLILWVIISNRKDICLSAKIDIPIIVSTLLLLAVSMAVIYFRSASEIHDMMNTAYPGTTRVNYPERAGSLFTNLVNILSPYTEMFVGGSNVCETAGMFTLFPLGILLSIVAMIRRKKADAFCIIMTAVGGFLALFTFFDVPEWLRTITLMNMTMSYRVLPCFALTQVLLLFRAVSILLEEKRIRWFIGVPVAAVIAWFINWELWKYNHVQGYEWVYICLLAGTFMACCAAICSGRDPKGRSLFATLMIVVSLFAGGTVNPVQIGTDEIEKSTVIAEIKEVVQEDPEGKWIVEHLAYPVGMLPTMAGAPTINCANNYPNLALWSQLDPEGDDEYFYNRFAVQIVTYLVEEDNSVFRAGPTEDQFVVDLDVDDLHLLDVSYILSNQELEQFSKEEVKIEKIRKHGAYNIYHVSYNGQDRKEEKQ